MSSLHRGRTGGARPVQVFPSSRDCKPDGTRCRPWRWVRVIGSTVSHLVWALVRELIPSVADTARRHSREPIEGVLFDLDDTLIDWWGSLTTCLEETADHEVSEALLAHCREAYWETHPEHGHVWHRNTWALHHRRHTDWPLALPHLDGADLELLLGRFDDALWVGFYPDTVPTMDLLLTRHTGSIRFGILSNNGLLPAEVERLRLHDWFEVAVSAEPAARKPHPDAFRLGCDALGTDPRRTVYVGDSVKADALGALGAGLVPVWVDRWNDSWPGRPDEVHRITTLEDLPALVDSLLRGDRLPHLRP
jgi:putative hydrolase of the HAD superfamily